MINLMGKFVSLRPWHPLALGLCFILGAGSLYSQGGQQGGGGGQQGGGGGGTPTGMTLTGLPTGNKITISIDPKKFIKELQDTSWQEYRDEHLEQNANVQVFHL